MMAMFRSGLKSLLVIALVVALQSRCDLACFAVDALDAAQVAHAVDGESAPSCHHSQGHGDHQSQQDRSEPAATCTHGSTVGETSNTGAKLRPATALFIALVQPIVTSQAMTMPHESQTLLHSETSPLSGTPLNLRI